jgi:hypothetical protein
VDQTYALTLSGGRDSTFTTQLSTTKINYFTIDDTSGTVSVENIVLLNVMSRVTNMNRNLQTKRGNIMKITMKILLALLLTVSIGIVIPVSALAADRLIIKNGEGATTFKVQDDGMALTTAIYTAQTQFPGFWLDETGPGHKGAYFVLGENWLQVQRRAQGFGAYEASPVFINIGAPHSAFVISETGYVGFGQWGPSYPLHMASGAHCTAGGVWTNASSREYKQEIKDLTTDEAMDTLKGLNPVKFSYRASSDEKHVGFIAEDVPDLVATADRKGMSAMDVVAVLTKVVQEQQKTVQGQKLIIAELSKRLDLVEKRSK